MKGLNMNKASLYLLFFLCITIGVAIMVSQFLIWGHIWDVGQCLHHEFFASVLFAFSVGIIVAIFALKGGKRRG